MKKVAKIILISLVFLAVILCAADIIVIKKAEKDFIEAKKETKELYVQEEFIPQDEEDPLESIKIEQAVIATIGTDREISCWGFSITNVAKSIYAEAGANSEELQRAILTCIWNAQKQSGWRKTPEEVIAEKQYDTCDEYSEEVMEVCIDVLLRSNLYQPIVDSEATVFHCLGLGNSNYHDNHCEWTGITIDGVNFYKELNVQ